MTDDDLRRDVAAELCWDPRLDSAAIEVSAAGGMVTLRGTVASLWHKRAGGNAAGRVRGVTRIANELRVQIPDRDGRDDEDVRGRRAGGADAGGFGADDRRCAGPGRLRHPDRHGGVALPTQGGRVPHRGRARRGRHRKRHRL